MIKNDIVEKLNRENKEKQIKELLKKYKNQ